MGFEPIKITTKKDKTAHLKFIVGGISDDLKFE
jgi:hypothetical protein